MVDVKITGLPENTAPLSTDVVEIAGDPGGTPASKKAEIRNLFKGGGQIAFPATAVPSADPNTLDDYEEGSFTGAITSGTGSIVTDVDTGYYTKIGRAVTLIGCFTVASVSTPGGNLQITGLPFPAINISLSADTAVAVTAGGLETTATTSVVGTIENNSSTILLQTFAAGALTNMAVDVKAGSSFVIGVTYFT